MGKLLISAVLSLALLTANGHAVFAQETKSIEDNTAILMQYIQEADAQIGQLRIQLATARAELKKLKDAATAAEEAAKKKEAKK